MAEEEVLLQKVLIVQARELAKTYEYFSHIMAGGYSYKEPMKKVIEALSQSWELVSTSFDLAWIQVGDNEDEHLGWKSLEKIETLMRTCLNLEPTKLSKASSLLYALGILSAESIKCYGLWFDEMPVEGLGTTQKAITQ